MGRKNTVIFQVLHLILLASLIECRGSSHGGGSHSSGSHSSSHSSSHSTSHTSSHSSSGGSHYSSGGSHYSNGGSHYGGGSHISNGNGHYGGSNNVHVSNTHVTNTHHGSIVHHPYQAHTVMTAGGGVHYHPAVQLHYSPPVHTVHVIPVFHPPPTVVAHSVHYDYNSGAHSTNQFLAGYLIARASGNLNHNTYVHHTVVHHNDDSDYYYTVHNHYQNSESVPARFTITGNTAVECPENTSDALCIPNSDALCLRNETIMCVTSLNLTVPCGEYNTMRCVFTKIPCNGDPSCPSTQNDGFIDYYVPCLSNVTLANNRVDDHTTISGVDNYELCVTAIAEPKKLESPVGPAVVFLQQLGLYALNELSEMNNRSMDELFRNQTAATINNTLGEK